MADLSVLTVAGAGPMGGDGWWLPTGASSFAHRVDGLVNTASILGLLSILIIVGLALLFLFGSGRREEGVEPSAPSVGLQLATGLGVALIAGSLFYAGFTIWIDMITPPANAYEITVSAQPGSWHFTYPNEHVDGELHVPVGRPVILHLLSRNLAYTFSAPALRLRSAVIPGREGELWFEATQPGRYEAVCARYAGEAGGEMVAPVVVHKRGEFASWLKSVSDFLSTLPPEEAGRKLYDMNGCAQCHSLDGSRKTGPSFKGIFGHEAELADGSTVVVDLDYVKESILQPKAKVVKGFEPVMPPFAGRISEKETEAIAAFLQSLSDAPKDAENSEGGEAP